MKKLCLIRHAKTTWSAGVDDYHRPLEERGENDAQELGKILLEHQLKPDLILASSAKRALDTATLIAKEVHYPDGKVITNEGLYKAGVEDLLQIVQGINNKYVTIYLVGHNPGLTLLANYLAEDHSVNLPTCGVYCVEFATEHWHDIAEVEGKTILVETPAHLHEHDYP
jgi:phosphohistidine phosphatase